jgi:hypothetical protein
MDPEERVEGCGLIQLVQDNIRVWALINMSVPHVVGNIEHLSNYQHVRNDSVSELGGTQDHVQMK